MTTAHRPTFDPVSCRKSVSFAPNLTETGPRQGGPTRPCIPPKAPACAYHSQAEATLPVCRFQCPTSLTIHRQPGQGGSEEVQGRDLRAELLKAEAAHFAKKNGTPIKAEEDEEFKSIPAKRSIESATNEVDEDEDPETKRRRLILEEAQELDADSAGSSEEDSDEEYVPSQ
jgi:hypothetical protein